MVNVSDAFKAALENDNRNFSGSCTITLTSGESIPIDNSQLWDNGFVIDDATSNTGGFDVGSAIAQKFTLRLNNMYDDFSDYDFTGAEISDVKVSLLLKSGKTESVPKGIYTVNETSYDGDIITLECLDNMHKFDVSYEKSNLAYPATLFQIVQDACGCCDVVLATDSLQFEYYDYVISEKPDDNTITFRDILTWVGQISGHFWKCNSKGQLTAGWYNMTDLSADTNIHTLQTNTVTDVSTDTDDVVITCVRVITEDENSNQVTYQSGSDGYTIIIDSNKLVTNDNAADIASMIGERVVGLRFRPMTVSTLQDPTIEAGDGAIVYDRKLKLYKTFFTNVVFSIDADNQMSNDAESALRNSAERFSEATKIYRDLIKRVNRNKTEWEKAYDELKKGMEGKNGLFPVMQKQEDGSTVLNFCDTPTLDKATVVVRLSANGWGMSTDGGKTWNAGALVDGTTITKILSAIGINADWINVGTLSGKYIDARGLVVLDSEGKNATFKVTEEGKVIILPEAFLLADKSIDQTIIEKAQEEAKKMTNLQVILSNENQGVSTNADGSYTTFPTCSTTLQVLRGAEDITADATYIVTEQDISGTWDADKHTYTVTGISADTGYVDFLVKYQELSVEKRFTVTKQKQGTSGADAVMYYTEADATVVMRSTDGTYVPETILFKNYKKTGANAASYSSYIRVQTSVDGSTFTDIKSALLLSGQYTLTLSSIGEDVTAIRYILEDTSLPRKTLAVLTIPVINDAELTEKQIFNILTDNGTRDLLTYVDGKLYLNGTYIKGKTIDADKLNVEDLRSVAAAIAQWLIKTNYIQSKNGNIVLYSDGRLKIGSSIFQKNSGDEACVVKYGLHIYCKDNSTEDFSDGSGMLFISGLTSSTSGTTLVLKDKYVYKLSSSSRRYKDHVRNMDLAEAEKLLNVPVVWFRYKDGYLHHGDRNEGKPIPGFYAEDVFKQFPEGVVLNDDDQIEDWNYRTMIPAMLKIIQDQQERISKLEQLMEGKNE